MSNLERTATLTRSEECPPAALEAPPLLPGRQRPRGADPRQPRR